MPNMNRRAFLSLLGSAAAVAAMPLPEFLHFDPAIARLPAPPPMVDLFDLKHLTMALAKEIEAKLEFPSWASRYDGQIGSVINFVDSETMKQTRRAVVLTDQFGVDAEFDPEKGLHESVIHVGAKVMADRFNRLGQHERGVIFARLPIPTGVENAVVVQSDRFALRGILQQLEYPSYTWRPSIRFDSLAGSGLYSPTS